RTVLRGESGSNTADPLDFDILEAPVPGQATVKKLGTLTTTGTDTPVVSGWLEPGDYVLVETSVTGDYTEDNKHIEFTIEAGKTTQLTGEHAAVSSPKGKVTVENFTMLNNTKFNVAGITFNVYKAVEDIDGNYIYGDGGKKYKKLEDTPVAFETSDANETYTRILLDEGIYIVEETVPEGSPVRKPEADDTMAEGASNTFASRDYVVLTVQHNKDTSVIYEQKIQFYNPAIYGQLKIKKVDANNTNKGLEATFKVFLDKNCTEPAYDIKNEESKFTTDNSTGVGISFPLPAGTNYYLKETKTPDGYTYTDGGVFGPYTIESNTITDLSSDSTKYITNTKQFSIKVTKKATNSYDSTKATLYGSEVVAGAEIGLYESDAADTEPVAIGTTDSNGVMTFTGLKFTQEPKIWYVREITPPVNGKYVLNTTFYPVEVSYGDGTKTEFTINPGEDNEGILYDDEKGNVSITKLVRWQGEDTPAKDVEFALYAVSERGQVHKESSTAAATLITDTQGKAKSKPLDAGWYELVETKVPEGYAEAPSYWVEIKNNEESTTLYNAGGNELSNTIVNEADKGKFILYKWDGDKDTNSSSLTRMDQAQFTIERKVSESPEKWEYAVNNDREQSIITVQDDTDQPGNYRYESGYLEPGTYRIKEIKTPTYTYDDGGTQQTITFALNGDAQEFMVIKGQTLDVNAYNSPQGSITLTVYSQYDKDDVNVRKTLAGATFKLYKDEACTKEIKNSLRTADANGVCRWENLDPGTYYMKETEDGKTAVNNAGFEISTEIQSVEIEAGALVAKIASQDEDISSPEKEKIYKEVISTSRPVLKPALPTPSPALPIPTPALPTPTPALPTPTPVPEKSAAPIISDVKVSGNNVQVILEDISTAAQGYDYVISENKNCIVDKDYLQVNKNILITNTTFRYVQQGTYYVYCHSWTRGEDNKKVFSHWSQAYEVKVSDYTPAAPKIVGISSPKKGVVEVTVSVSEGAEGYDIILGKSIRKVNGEKRPVDYGKNVLKKRSMKTKKVVFRNVKPGTVYAALHSYTYSENKTKVFSKWSGYRKIKVK
ncbi:MAG: SpaA isopeptide-forming pilin-related protein, partial [Eubacteriales bacterium]|nr:SpaA isopeptide-forming pilin-related protein [Eubacteriales bacterium]